MGDFFPIHLISGKSPRLKKLVMETVKQLMICLSLGFKEISSQGSSFYIVSALTSQVLKSARQVNHKEFNLRQKSIALSASVYISDAKTKATQQKSMVTSTLKAEGSSSW